MQTPHLCHDTASLAHQQGVHVADCSDILGHYSSLHHVLDKQSVTDTCLTHGPCDTSQCKRHQGAQDTAHQRAWQEPQTTTALALEQNKQQLG